MEHILYGGADVLTSRLNARGEKLRDGIRAVPVDDE